MAEGGRLRRSDRFLSTDVKYTEQGYSKRALCIMCIGVGQGIALAIERV
jgi:acetyl-CoA acetyltransferase